MEAYASVVIERDQLSARNAELEAKLAESQENLEVCQRLSDTFWDALKPLGLKEIYLSCPGQHVVDLIRERDQLKAKLAALVEAAEEVVRISDRKHDAWDKLKDAIKAAKETP